MGKYSLGKATTAIDSRMNQDEVYLNPEKADPIVQDLQTQYTKLQKALENQAAALNKAVKQGVVKGSYAKTFTGWAKKCSTQAAATQRKSKGLKSKYDADAKQQVINGLLSKVDTLSAKLAAMENQVSEQDATIKSQNATIQSQGETINAQSVKIDDLQSKINVKTDNV